MTNKDALRVAQIIKALKHQKQCDEEGVMCIVSRQAVEEAITFLSGANDAQQNELKLLSEILKEASDILSGERELRLPIIDELYGFSLMLDAQQEKTEDAKQVDNQNKGNVRDNAFWMQSVDDKAQLVEAGHKQAQSKQEGICNKRILQILDEQLANVGACSVEIWPVKFAKAIEREVRKGAQPSGESEAVAWVDSRSLEKIKDFDITAYAKGGFDYAVPLYTSPLPKAVDAEESEPTITPEMALFISRQSVDGYTPEEILEMATPKAVQLEEVDREKIKNDTLEEAIRMLELLMADHGECVSIIRSLKSQSTHSAANKEEVKG